MKKSSFLLISVVILSGRLRANVCTSLFSSFKNVRVSFYSQGLSRTEPGAKNSITSEGTRSIYLKSQEDGSHLRPEDINTAREIERLSASGCKQLGCFFEAQLKINREFHDERTGHNIKNFTLIDKIKFFSPTGDSLSSKMPLLGDGLIKQVEIIFNYNGIYFTEKSPYVYVRWQGELYKLVTQDKFAHDQVESLRGLSDAEKIIRTNMLFVKEGSSHVALMFNSLDLN